MINNYIFSDVYSLKESKYALYLMKIIKNYEKEKNELDKIIYKKTQELKEIKRKKIFKLFIISP